MNEQTIYVVIGTTGEYSDCREWMVAAYMDKAMAEQHVTLASASAPKGDVDWQDYEAKNPYDPGMSVDYTGTQYYAVDVPLLSAIPGPQP
ncbi:MAG TPA: hypothetical protein VEY92_08675 [Pseudoxanthomonas sp.]|nr:hypothetical protein [Pseudoxanthomonas sp.]